MDIFELILFHIILITFPFLVYLFYLAYSRDFEEEERSLFLDIALLSSIYLTMRFPMEDQYYINLLLMNIPLMIAYIMDRKISIVAITFLIIAKYNQVFSWPIYGLVLEYGIYYFLSRILIKKYGKNQYLFVTAFTSVKWILFTIMLALTKIKLSNELGMMMLCYGIGFFSITYFVVFIFYKGRDVMKLHMSLKELEQDTQIKTSLFKITHEIKNPIAVCKGYLDMFDVNNVEHSRKYIPIMKDEINRTLFLLQDFLCMTKVTIERDIIDINLLLEDVIESYHLLLKSHNIKLNTDLIDDEIYINGDYNRLNQVFLNIVKNSIEAIGSNGIIAIQCKLENGQIIIQIQDNGCGISKENMKQIQVPFFTTKQLGTGLGVSLSYEIIKAHGGKIHYDSTLGRGTTVTIKLNTLDEV